MGCCQSSEEDSYYEPNVQVMHDLTDPRHPELSRSESSSSSDEEVKAPVSRQSSRKSSTRQRPMTTEQSEVSATSYTTNEKLFVTLKLGSIVDEQVAVLVNATGPDLNLAAGGGVSAAILEASGISVQQECNEKYPRGVKIGEIVETQAGSLHATALYHGAIANWGDQLSSSNSLKSFVGHCLTLADQQGRTSIGFPALGTGGRRVPPAVSASLIREAIQEFSQGHPKTKVKDIRIILRPSDKAVVKAFADELENNFRPVPSIMEGTFPLPPTWTKFSKGVTVTAVPLLSPSPEYDAVENTFKSGAQTNVNVHKIQRIQHKRLWTQYTISLDEAVKRLPGKLTVARTLYHGTAKENVAGINRNGFDRNYCDKEAKERPKTGDYDKQKKYGTGVYFAADPSDPEEIGHCPEDEDGRRFIYQCQVITGEFRVGTPEDKQLPYKSRNRKYDSLVDDQQMPSIFVIFNDMQAYPEYLIEFD